VNNLCRNISGKMHINTWKDNLIMEVGQKHKVACKSEQEWWLLDVDRITYALKLVLLKLPIYLIRVPLRLIYGKRKRDEVLASPSWWLYHWLDDQTHRLRLYSYLNPKFGLIWEKEVSEFVKEMSGGLFIDIGAGYGYYSVLLSQNFKKIIAIEPHPKIINSLRRNTRYLKNIVCLEAAISNKNGFLPLFLSEVNVGGHSLALSSVDDDVRKSSFPEDAKQSIYVKTITLNSLLKDYDNIDLIKVDVEGAEWSVLEGAQDVVNKINCWITELHDLNRKEEFETLFRKYGYKTSWIDKRHIFASLPQLRQVKKVLISRV
jgi:FkbM family methyltransferase